MTDKDTEYRELIAERDALQAEIENCDGSVDWGHWGGKLQDGRDAVEAVIEQWNKRVLHDDALRAENAELRKHAEAFDKMRKALQGIASCGTVCEGCEMMARIAREALK